MDQRSSDRVWVEGWGISVQCRIKTSERLYHHVWGNTGEGEGKGLYKDERDMLVKEFHLVFVPKNDHLKLALHLVFINECQWKIVGTENAFLLAMNGDMHCRNYVCLAFKNRNLLHQDDIHYSLTVPFFH